MKTCLCKWVLFGVTFLLVIEGRNSWAKTFEEDVTLTAEQKNILDKFKAKMLPKLPHEYMKTEIYLIKWLRARNYDVGGAEDFLMKHLRWREENGMDTISEEDWSDLETDMPYYLEGRDKLGRSILYFDIGHLDFRKYVLEGKTERLLRYLDKALEEACTLVRTLGEKYMNITRGQLILNMDGYDLVQHGCFRCLPVILRFAISYENNYPECADKLIAVNTPAIVEPVLQAVRNVMSPDTREAIKIYGTNRNHWKTELAKDFDFSMLPPSIGGTRVYQGMQDY